MMKAITVEEANALKPPFTMRYKCASSTSCTGWVPWYYRVLREDGEYRYGTREDGTPWKESIGYGGEFCAEYHQDFVLYPEPRLFDSLLTSLRSVL